MGRRANTFGALDMGLAPDLLPGRVNLDGVGCANLAAEWGEVPQTRGKSTTEILAAADAGEIRFLLLSGADPVTDLGRFDAVREALAATEYLVSVDIFVNDSNRNADVILPATAFAEKEGTVTNIEGRVQKVNAITPGPGQSRTEWSILADLADHVGRPLGLASAETIAKEIAVVAPAYEDVSWEALEWDHRDGLVVPINGSQAVNHIPVSVKGSRAPRAALTLHVARTMYDDGVRLRHCPSLHPLGVGARAYLSVEDSRRLGARDGSPVKVVTNHGEGEFSAVIDEGTPEGVVFVPFNQVGAAHLGTDPVVRVTSL
jgi:predicted molibdopterin-dependent oxidoreductase YjgC